MAKRDASLYRLSVDLAAGTLTLTAGTYVKALHVEGIDDERNRMAALHGYKQKVADKGAKSADPLTGKVDPEVRKAAVVAEMERLVEGGVWNAGGGGGGGMGADAALLVVAFGLAKPEYGEAEVREKVKALAANVRMALVTVTDPAKNPLAPYVAQARERIAATVDLSDTMDALGLGDDAE